MKRPPALALALALACCIPAAAQTPAASTPPGESKIEITQCDVHVHGAHQSHPWIDPYGYWHYDPATFPSWDAFLHVEFVNRAPLAAKEIDFAFVSSDALVAVAKDVGTFSTGVTIDHEFVVTREVMPLGGQSRCDVLRVKYEDGSVWTNSLPPER